MAQSFQQAYAKLTGKAAQPQASEASSFQQAYQKVITQKPTTKAPTLDINNAKSSGGLTFSKPQQNNQPQSNPLGDFVGGVYKGIVGEVGSILHPQQSAPQAQSLKLPSNLSLHFVNQPQKTQQAPSAQLKNPQQTDNVTKTASSVFHGTLDQLQQVLNDPLGGNAWDNLKKDPKKVITDYLQSIPQAHQDIGKNVQNVKTDIKTGQPVSKVAGDELKTIVSQANFVLSPITGLFTAADKVPVLNTVSRLITLPFTFAGESGVAVSNKVVDALPISQQAKNNIREGTNEIFALAAQIALGHATEVSATKKAALVDKFGEKDATTIVDQAQKLAEEKAVKPGTYTPQELRNQVFEKHLEETPHGKEIIKASLQADQRGQGIEIKEPAVKSYLREPKSDMQKYAHDYILNNFDKAKEDYYQRIKKEFGTDNVISADDAKYVIPNFKAESSGDYHSPASSLSKVVYDELLQKNKGRGDNNVLFMSGGTGSGKTTAIKHTLGDAIKNSSIAYDTNLTGVESASSKIDKALANGYKVDIVYVQRDPVTAFEHGVIPRARTEGRVISIDEHINRHLDAFKTLEELKNKYGDKIHVAYIDNTGGEMKDAKLSTFDNLPKFNYTKDELRTILNKKADEAVIQHKNDETRGLTEQEATAIRKSKESGSGTSKQDSSSNGSRNAPERKANTKVNPRNNPEESPNQQPELTIRRFDKSGKEIDTKVKYKRILTTQEVRSIRQVLETKLEHLRQTATDPVEYGKEIDKLVADIMDRSKGDKVIISALRTELNKEMFGIAGAGGNYKEAYAQLMEIRKNDPEMGPLVDKIDDHIKKLDDMLFSAPDKSEQQPAFKQRQVAQKGFNGVQEPVGTGKPRKSALYKHFVEDLAANDPKLYDQIKDKPDVLYNKVNQEYDFEKALELVEKNPQKAYNVAKGYEAPPEGVRQNSIARMLAQTAKQEGNTEVMRDVVNTLSLRATRQGQEIYALRGWFTNDSTQDYMKKLIDLRLKNLGGSLSNTIDMTARAFGKNLDSAKAKAIAKVDRQVEKAQKKIQKERQMVVNMQKFLDDLTCK